MDGYTANNKLARPHHDNDAIILAGCGSHSRCKFYELHTVGSQEVVTTAVERMLWQVEKTVRGQSPDIRVAARQEASAAVVADLFDLCQQTLPRISGKSKLGEAIRYAVSRRPIFELFLSDGRVELHSNIVERAIRPETITRKNRLFAGSDGGGRTWAIIVTPLQTETMNNVDPIAWLAPSVSPTAAEQRNRRAYAKEPRHLTASACRLRWSAILVSGAGRQPRFCGRADRTAWTQ